MAQADSFDHLHDNYPNDHYDLHDLLSSIEIEHWNVDIRGSGNVVIKLAGKLR